MGGHYFLTIPVKKHIQKFVTASEGDVISLRNHSFICYLLRPYFTYKIHSGHHYQDISKSFPGTIKIKLVKSNVRIYGLQPRLSQIGFINKVLSMHIARELTLHVQLFLKKEGRYRGYNEALRDFCTRHNIIIDEDISLDALQKLEYRGRKKNKKSVA
jgi:hypothetical protein